MDIREFLQRENARLSYEDKWLVFNDDGEYEVYQHKYGKKGVRVLYRGSNENEAIMTLKNGDAVK